MFRLLLDENLPTQLTVLLRAQGFDVIHVRDAGPDDKIPDPRPTIRYWPTHSWKIASVLRSTATCTVFSPRPVRKPHP